MNEKDEKFDEKEMEKHEEKSAEEKNFDEKYRRDPLGAIIWAVILIWGGVVLLLNNLNILDQLNLDFANLPFDFPFPDQAWTLVFLGAGLIILVELVIRLLVPDYRRPLLGTFIVAMVFLGIAFGSGDLIWAVALIIIGDLRTGAVTAPMMSRVVKVCIEVGAEVKAGQALVVVEAMKMESELLSTKDGKVAEVFCAVGDTVEQGKVLVKVD